MVMEAEDSSNFQDQIKDSCQAWSILGATDF